MDNTMKKYEHRQLAWVCEHECNVGEGTPASLGFWPKLVYAHGSKYPLPGTEEDPEGSTG